MSEHGLMGGGIAAHAAGAAMQTSLLPLLPVERHCTGCNRVVDAGQVCRNPECEYAWADLLEFDDASLKDALLAQRDQRRLWHHPVTCWRCAPAEYVSSTRGYEEARRQFAIHTALHDLERLLEGWPKDYCPTAAWWRTSGHAGGRDGCPAGLCERCDARRAGE